MLGLAKTVGVRIEPWLGGPCWLDLGYQATQGTPGNSILHGQDREPPGPQRKLTKCNYVLAGMRDKFHWREIPPRGNFFFLVGSSFWSLLVAVDGRTRDRTVGPVRVGCACFAIDFAAMPKETARCSSTLHSWQAPRLLFLFAFTYRVTDAYSTFLDLAEYARRS